MHANQVPNAMKVHVLRESICANLGRRAGAFASKQYISFGLLLQHANVHDSNMQSNSSSTVSLGWRLTVEVGMRQPAPHVEEKPADDGAAHAL